MLTAQRHHETKPAGGQANIAHTTPCPLCGCPTVYRTEPKRCAFCGASKR